MTSLSTADGRLTLRPLLWSKRLHRQGVYLLAHSLSQRAVNDLVLLDTVLVAEFGADNNGLEMLAIANHFDVFTSKAILNIRFNGLGTKHDISGGLALGSQLVAASNHQQGRE